MTAIDSLDDIEDLLYGDDSNKEQNPVCFYIIV